MTERHDNISLAFRIYKKQKTNKVKGAPSAAPPDLPGATAYVATRPTAHAETAVITHTLLSYYPSVIGCRHTKRQATDLETC